MVFLLARIYLLDEEGCFRYVHNARRMSDCPYGIAIGTF